MTPSELRSLKIGDKILSIAWNRFHTVGSVDIKEYDGYTHASFVFVDGTKSFCCTHCNGSLWATTPIAPNP
jgi:hypothetical protein